MKTYKIILSENDSYTVEAERLYLDSGFLILVKCNATVVIAPSFACIVCLGEVESR